MPAVGDADIRAVLRRMLAEHRRRARFQRLGHILVTVHRIAAHGDEQVARLYGAGVIADIADLRFGVGGALQHRDRSQQLL